MTEAAIVEQKMPKAKRKGSWKWPLRFGFALAILCAISGFYLTWTDKIPWLGGDEIEVASPHALPQIAYVAVDPVVVSLGPQAQNRHLRFVAQLEVEKAYAADVTLLMPRILDVLNSYLRAIEPSQIEDSGALTRIRAQILRRLQIVTGEGRIRDLLVSEFILN